MGSGIFYPQKRRGRAQYGVKTLEERAVKEKAKRDEAWEKSVTLKSAVEKARKGKIRGF